MSAAPRNARRPRWSLLPVLLPLVLLAGAAWRGVDFGRHWDEHVQIEALTNSMQSGRPLPGWYNYPSMCFWIGWAALSPELVHAWRTPDTGPNARAEARKALREFAVGREFRLRLRTCFLALGSLAVLWVYLAILVRATWWQALFGAGVLAGSWEVGYHLRWIAPDAIAMQFAAATLCAAHTGLERRSRRWVVAAAVCAGLATSTKYPAGLLLLPVAIAALGLAGEGLRSRARALVLPTVAFALAYLAITPGTLFEHERFLADVAFEAHHYRAVGHYGFTVGAGPDHAARATRYVAGVLLSPYPALAWALTALALVGAVSYGLRAPRTLLLWASFPVTYFAYFVTLRVMFVRNWLVLVPMLAFFAAEGAAVLVRAARRRPLQVAVAGLLTAPLVANAVFQVRAAESIREWTRLVGLQSLVDHAAAHPERKYRVFPEVSLGLKRRKGELPANLAPRMDDADAVVLYNREIPWGNVESNRPGFAEAIFGPLDVHFDYYTSWPERRILVVPVAEARAMGILR